MCQLLKQVCRTLTQPSQWFYTPPQKRGIDPVAEAEVFLAYGKQKEAVRVLEYTIQLEPDNLPAHLLLLQAYTFEANAFKYKQLAQRLHDQLSHTPTWVIIVQEGLRLLPEDSFFRQMATASP